MEQSSGRPSGAGTTGAGAEPGLALELLVHGVGGTTPEEMLADPHLSQLTGDGVAGTYRRWPDRHAEDHPGEYRHGAVEEAYSWAGLTSGSAGRALWLLLLPFMFANLAHWMRPPAPRAARAQGLYDIVVRVLAASLTVLITAAACEAALDLTAWQCAGTAACAAHHSWLGFLSAARAEWWSQPGRRLALGAVVPLALVGVLWWLSHLTWTSYEAQRPAPSAKAATAAAAATRTLPPMEMPGFWYGMRVVRRLRMVHVAVGLLTIALAVLLPTLHYDRSAHGPLAVAGWILAGLLAVLAAGVVFALVRSSRRETRQDDRPDSVPMRSLHWAALGLLLAVVLYAGWDRGGWQSGGRLIGAGAVFAVLCLVQLALVLLLAVAALLLRSKGGAPGGAAVPPETPVIVPGPRGADSADGEDRSGGDGPGGGDRSGGVAGRERRDASGVGGSAPGPADGPESAEPAEGAELAEGPGSGEPLDTAFGGPDGPALLGLAGPATAMLAVGLGNLFTAGATVWAAQWLMGKGTLGLTLPGPPLLLTWHSSGVPVLAALLAVPVLGLGVRLLLRRHRLEPQVDAAYRPGRQTSTTRSGQIAGALAKAELIDAGPVLIGTVAALAFLLAAASLAGALLSGRTPALAAAGEPSLVAYAATALQSTGAWLVGMFTVLLVAVGRAAYKQVSTRRVVGVFWDIGTFWPRAAHPFAPPCYAERAVPDLHWRIRTWLDADPRRQLVLSGHSQGTVLAAAAVWQLDPETRARVALLTYGCPLRRLYGRFFPGFMGPEDLLRLHRDAPCWRNLFRVTDYIGGPVRVPVPAGRPAVDAPVFVDPLAYDRDREHPLPVPILAHSDYRVDPRFTRERNGLLRRL